MLTSQTCCVVLLLQRQLHVARSIPDEPTLTLRNLELLLFTLPPLLYAGHHLMPSESHRFADAHLYEIGKHLLIPLDQIQMLQQLTVVAAWLSYIPEDLQAQIDIVFSCRFALLVRQATFRRCCWQATVAAAVATAAVVVVGNCVVVVVNSRAVAIAAAAIAVRRRCLCLQLGAAVVVVSVIVAASVAVSAVVAAGVIAVADGVVTVAIAIAQMIESTAPVEVWIAASR